MAVSCTYVNVYMACLHVCVPNMSRCPPSQRLFVSSAADVPPPGDELAEAPRLVILQDDIAVTLATSHEEVLQVGCRRLDAYLCMYPSTERERERWIDR